MPRPQRIHVEGGTYYVIQRSGKDQTLFCRPEDYDIFESLLAVRLRMAGARLHGYCWTPESVHLIVQVRQISLSRFMQVLTNLYARTVRTRRHPDSGYFFRERYRAALIDPVAYLPRLVRYVHYVPVLRELASAAAVAEHTSYQAYAGTSVVPIWLTKSATLKLHKMQDAEDWESFMQRAPAPEDVALFSKCFPVIGGAAFLKHLPRDCQRYRSRASLDGIIDTVAYRLGLDREGILSGSRQREFALARALIAWYASNRGAAKMSEVARVFRRHPSTLSLAIRGHRKRLPDLFKMTSIHDLGPLVPLSAVARICASTDDTHPIRQESDDDFIGLRSLER